MKKFFTKEWWTIMKIGVTQLFLALSFCGVTLAHNNYAQVLEQKVSIHVTDAPLEDVLHEIANAANVFFSYSPDLISTKNRVTYHAENKSIRCCQKLDNPNCQKLHIVVYRLHLIILWSNTGA